MSSISAPELASVSSMVFDSISRCASRFCAVSSSLPLARASPAKSVRPAFTRSTLVWIMLVEWAMPSVWRSTMPTISLTSRTVSLIVPKPDCAARLRSTPVLISVVTAPASRVSSPIVEAIWLVAARVSCASFFTSAATTAKLRPASPARAASMVAFRPACWSCGRSSRWSRRPSGPGSSPRRSRPCARPAGRPVRSGP